MGKKGNNSNIRLDIVWCKYPFLDTVWYNTDRNRLEMFRFKAIFAFAESFCRFKILGRVLDHNRDTIGLFSLTHLCGKLCCVWQWIIHIMYSVPFGKRSRYTAPYGLHFRAACGLTRDRTRPG